MQCAKHQVNATQPAGSYPFPFNAHSVLPIRLRRPLPRRYGFTRVNSASSGSAGANGQVSEQCIL